MKKGLKVFGWVILGFFAFCVLVAIFSDDDSAASQKEQKQETEQQVREQKQIELTESKI